jgi:hypothetical protein
MSRRASWIRHPGTVVALAAVITVVLTVFLVANLVNGARQSACRPVALLAHKPEPRGLTPSEVASYEYNRHAYTQLYLSLGCG